MGHVHKPGGQVDKRRAVPCPVGQRDKKIIYLDNLASIYSEKYKTTSNLCIFLDASVKDIFGLHYKH